MPEKDQKKEPIKVTDRRSFTLEGERRVQQPEAEPDDRQENRGGTVRGEAFELKTPTQDPAPGAMPSQDFSSFVLSLASTAFIQLGDLEDPVTGRTELNLEGARQMIEILGMLQSKTRGNLEAREKEFLDGVLYELKLKFAQKAQRR